jgi:tRNA nucleotidyltransferase (CCA-adding enzyme)
MEHIEKLNKILLSENVVSEFHNKYAEDSFKSWLLSIIPEIEECKNQQQDNPWHIYNCLDHILHSIEEMNKLSKHLDEHTRLILSFVMFLHDTGKPECHVRRFRKNYGREVDGFFNHQIASHKIAKRVLSKFGFDENDSKIISKLVLKHDMFMLLTLDPQNKNQYKKLLTPRVLEDEIEKLNEVGNGLQLMEYLIMVGRSDTLAQNPKMTKKSLELNFKMKEMLENLKTTRNI